VAPVRVSYLLAAGYTMLYDEHVRVDIVYSRGASASAPGQFHLRLPVRFPSVFLVIYTATPFIRNSFMVNEARPIRAVVPARWR